MNWVLRLSEKLSEVIMEPLPVRDGFKIPKLSEKEGRKGAPRGQSASSPGHKERKHQPPAREGSRHPSKAKQNKGKAKKRDRAPTKSSSGHTHPKCCSESRTPAHGGPLAPPAKKSKAIPASEGLTLKSVIIPISDCVITAKGDVSRDPQLSCPYCDQKFIKRDKLIRHTLYDWMFAVAVTVVVVDVVRRKNRRDVNVARELPAAGSSTTE